MKYINSSFSPFIEEDSGNKRRMQVPTQLTTNMFGNAVQISGRMVREKLVVVALRLMSGGSMNLTLSKHTRLHVLCCTYQGS